MTNLKISETNSESVQKMQELRNESLVLGTTIEDMVFVTILLNSLPYMYHNFVSSLRISSRIEVPSFAEVVGLLI